MFVIEPLNPVFRVDATSLFEVEYYGGDFYLDPTEKWYQAEEEFNLILEENYFINTGDLNAWLEFDNHQDAVLFKLKYIDA